MSTAPSVFIVATEAFTQLDVKVICRELEDFGLNPSFGDPLERRGVGIEDWQFILNTDWAVVRDTVIASGLTAGIAAGATAVSHAAERLAAMFGTFHRNLPRGPGFFIIRDTRNHIELQIPAVSAMDAMPWLKLLEHQVPVTSLRWNESKHRWMSDD